MKTSLAVALVVFAGSALAVDATDPERLAEAHALMGVMQVERQIDGMASGMAQAMAREMVRGKPLQNERVMRITMEEAMLGMKEGARAPGGLIDTLAAAYASQFTTEELRQIREFYQTPAGTHLLIAAPEVMKQVFPQFGSSARAMAPKVCAKVKARLAVEKIESVITCPAAP